MPTQNLFNGKTLWEMHDFTLWSCYNKIWLSLKCWTYFTHQYCACQEFRELLGISFLYCNISRLVLLKCYFNIVVKRIFISPFLRWKQTSTVYMWTSISRIVVSAANPYEILNQEVFFLPLTQILLFLSYLLIPVSYTHLTLPTMAVV